MTSSILDSARRAARTRPIEHRTNEETLADYRASTPHQPLMADGDFDAVETLDESISSAAKTKPMQTVRLPTENVIRLHVRKWARDSLAAAAANLADAIASLEKEPDEDPEAQALSMRELRSALYSIRLQLDVVRVSR